MLTDLDEQSEHESTVRVATRAHGVSNLADSAAFDSGKKKTRPPALRITPQIRVFNAALKHS